MFLAGSVNGGFRNNLIKWGQYFQDTTRYSEARRVAILVRSIHCISYDSLFQP